MLHGIKIQKLLVQRDEIPNVWEKIRLTKEAISIADKHQDIEWGFSLRNELMELEHETSQCKDSFHAFNWLIQTFDENPDLLSADDLMWKYKWMIYYLRRDYRFSLEQIKEVDEDFKERMLKHGFSIRPLYNCFLDDAIFYGKKEEAEKWMTKMKNEFNDDLSNCKACELDTFIDYEVAFGDHKQAVTMAAPLVNKSLSCKSVPLSTFALLANSLIKKGEKEEAEKFFSLTEQLFASKDKESRNIKTLIQIIQYLALKKDTKGYEYLDKFNSWAVDAEPEFQYEFFTSAALLAQRIPKKELRLNLSEGFSIYRESQVYSSEELFSYFNEQGEKLAKLFDERNGNNFYTESLRDTLVSEI
jgi:hypothetical protein